MSRIKLSLQFALPAIAAIALGCAHQPAPVSPAVAQSTAQADTGHLSVLSVATNDYSVQRGGRGGGGGSWSGKKGGGGGSWTGKKGNGGGNWTGKKGGGGGGWSDRHGGHHTYTYGRHWSHGYGWWGHGGRYNTAGWWGAGNWWTYGGTPWWGLGYEPTWLATASLVPSQFVLLSGYYYPFYNVAGMVYPDYSRPFIASAGTYAPYDGATPTVPNQGESLPATSAQIVTAPAGISD